VALDFASNAPDVTLRTGRRRLETILRNLVSNAIKYTANGSVRVSPHRSGSSLRVSVEDTGIGIPASERGAVFELCRRGADEEVRRRPGSGIGLFVVGEYARQISGTVELTSVEGRGSRFDVVLALDASATQAAS
jgi:signal transduction histidine kinase